MVDPLINVYSTIKELDRSGGSAWNGITLRTYGMRMKEHIP